METGEVRESGLKPVFEKPGEFFISDFKAVFDQHAKMWGVYSDSLKLLVTVMSLPLLAAAVLITATKGELSFVKLPPVMVAIVFITPAVTFFLLGVVIHHRQDILFYARALNGYRGIYEGFIASQLKVEMQMPMPIDPTFPPYYELLGPMGLIVHGSSVVSGGYVAAGVLSLTTYFQLRSWHLAGAILVAASFGLLIAALLEVYYWITAARSEPRFERRGAPAKERRPVLVTSRSWASRLERVLPKSIIQRRRLRRSKLGMKRK